MGNGEQDVHVIGGVPVPPEPQVQLPKAEQLVSAAQNHALIYSGHPAGLSERGAHGPDILRILPLAVVLRDGEKQTFLSVHTTFSCQTNRVITTSRTS